MTTEQEDMLPGTGFEVAVSIVLAGWMQAGKSEQARRVFNAHEENKSLERDPETGLAPKTARWPFRPMLLVYCEPSTAVTMADVIGSPDCAAVQVATPEELGEALARHLPEGHRGRRFGSVFFDGWTALCEAAKGESRELAQEEHGPKTTSQQATQNDDRKMAAAANRVVRNALRHWNAAAVAYPGTIFLSSAHADEKWIPKPQQAGKPSTQGERIQVGEQLDLPPKARRWLMNGCNLCILLQRVLPEADSMEQLEEAELEDATPAFRAIVKPVVVGGYEYDNVKWQAGVITGVKVAWRDPDLGEALLRSPLRTRK